jgi:hypothetical protein
LFQAVWPGVNQPSFSMSSSAVAAEDAGFWPVIRSPSETT